VCIITLWYNITQYIPTYIVRSNNYYMEIMRNENIGKSILITLYNRLQQFSNVHVIFKVTQNNIELGMCVACKLFYRA